MFNILDFIDSKAIRAFNKETKFSPAEQAILISKSRKTTVEEKVNALKELLQAYGKNEIWHEDHDGERIDFRKVIRNTIISWEYALEGRADKTGYVYTAYFAEQDFNDEMHRDELYFTSYDRAYQYLEEEKRSYLEDEDLRDCVTMGVICKVKLNDKDWEAVDKYYFDNELRLVALLPRSCVPGLLPGKRLCDPYPWCDYAFYIPVPFKAGDIVKVESPFDRTYYGVFSHEWEKPMRKEMESFLMSLDMYDQDTKKFWFTDDTCILDLEYCSDEELPEKENVLKGLSDVRYGKADFFMLLYHYDNLNEFFKTYQRYL